MTHMMNTIYAGMMVSTLTVGSTSAVELFELSEVRLTDGPFKHAQDVNRDHLLKYNPDRLLAPFRIDAGLAPKAEKYPSWESGGLDGHTAGHYLSALANMYAATGDVQCLRRLNYMVSELAHCQDANSNGYVGGIPNGKQLWEQVAAGDIRVSGFGLNDRWVPWYNLHKTFAGLRDAWVVAENKQARDVLVRLADWCDKLVANLTDEQMQEMLKAEHGGMNEVLADVAVITGDSKYLQLAQRFNHRAILDPLAQEHDKLDGLHANTQVPKVIGFQRIAALSQDAAAHTAARFFWQTVTQTRTLAFGGNSIAEHFPSPQQSIEWIEKREGPETCNTYNMLRLTEQLFAAEPEPRYADFYERAAFNHILSSHHPHHGGYVYFTPARPRHYRTYSQPGQAFWCCVGSGMENHGKYGQFIYAHTDEALFVNLFIASELTWKDKGLTLRQETQFPDEPRTRLTVKASQPIALAMHIRHPAWVKADEFQITINGEKQDASSTPSSYVTIQRTWRDGDVIEVELPMHAATEPLPHLPDYVALMYGPILIAAPTGTSDMPDLVAGTGRWEHIANGPLQPLDAAPMLVAKPTDVPNHVEPVPDQPLTFRFTDTVKPEFYRDLQLIPFFRVHDARYMMYWRIVPPENYARVIQSMESAEHAALALDRATVDRVAPGEQQPETDHHFQGHDTTTGLWRDRRYRHANGWFSYDLRAGEHKDLQLMVTYFGSDRRHFDILINDQLLQTVALDAPQPNQFMDVTYPIPNTLTQAAPNGVLTVKFVAKPRSMAGGIFDVRLLKPVEP